MFETAYRRRARPSIKSVTFSAALAAIAVLFAAWTGLFGLQFYAPAAIALFSAFAVLIFRVRGLRAALPKPYGLGRVTRIDPRRSARDGALIVVGGFASLVGVFASAFFLNPFLVFFPLTFGLMAGLPLSQLLYFAAVMRFEAAAGARIYTVTEDSTEDGVAVLLRSAELSPKKPDRASPH